MPAVAGMMAEWTAHLTTTNSNGKDTSMTTHDPALRITSNLLCLWALCGKLGCRRAKRCKGKPDDCITRYAPLVPEAARCGVLAVAAAGSYGIGDDDMRADAGAELAALEAWIAQVEAAYGDGQAAETDDHTHEQPHGA
jgi:hypothetical protein